MTDYWRIMGIIDMETYGKYEPDFVTWNELNALLDDLYHNDYDALTRILKALEPQEVRFLKYIRGEK